MNHSPSDTALQLVQYQRRPQYSFVTSIHRIDALYQINLIALITSYYHDTRSGENMKKQGKYLFGVQSDLTTRKVAQTIRTAATAITVKFVYSLASGR